MWNLLGSSDFELVVGFRVGVDEHSFLGHVGLRRN
jgi:hypothetical protein